MTSSQSIAWIGLGSMGMYMASNLADSIKPAELKVFNRTKSRSEELAAESTAIIDVCDTVAEAVNGTNVCYICLANDEALQSTIDAIIKARPSNLTVCDMSTVRMSFLVSH